MTIPKQYNPENIEDKWYAYWIKKDFFHSKPNPGKAPFTIVIPPPNVTGVLHMGHMLNNTIQDVLTRKARMEGREACWVPGTDHASIATEAKVVNMLKEKGIRKDDLGREKFLEHAWEWKEKYGGIILQQLRKLGCSCDWEREAFTMDDSRYEAVIDVFVKLYNDGFIYRGHRMVNWDPEGKTAVSDEEVIYKELNSFLYHINYKVVGSDEYVTIATTRPETILADTAVCINPHDERYSHLKGKKVIIPMVNREVPIIEDEYVSMEFGTGCLKVTPAHDENDYNLGQKHNLAIVDILNDNGTLNENAGFYIGEDRFAVRKKIVKDLDKLGLLAKTEPYTNQVGTSERTGAVIEPKLSQQWFLKMEELAKPALDNVMNDNIQFHPSKFKNMYKSWLENIRDWCISRQLWWGHRIPAWYLPDGSFVVARNEEDALKIAKEKDPLLSLSDLKQEEDVLDTWASSWLWPISVFDGVKDADNPEINYYYPTQVLVTAPEIIFFWVARMIIAGYYLRGEKPFEHVYFTGIVRDAQRRKMSKSLGNSPDPIELMKKYSTDGVRGGILFSSPAGNDLLYDEKLLEQGRNFCNKIWNAFRLIAGWKTESKPMPEGNQLAIQWMESRFYEALEQLEDHFNKFRISDALMVVYKLIWNDFCSWFLESIKPGYQEAIDEETLLATNRVLDKLMKVLHPFMPFITEEIWHLSSERDEDDCIIVAQWPDKKSFDSQLIADFEKIFEVITQVRNVRSSKNMSPKESIELVIKGDSKKYAPYEALMKKMANISSISYTSESISGAVQFVTHADEFFVPLSESVDKEGELQKLESELKYARGFLASVEKKLSNEKFVNNAPEKVVAMEKKKQEDAIRQIAALETSIKNLN